MHPTPISLTALRECLEHIGLRIRFFWLPYFNLIFWDTLNFLQFSDASSCSGFRSIWFHRLPNYNRKCAWTHKKSEVKADKEPTAICQSRRCSSVELPWMPLSFINYLDEHLMLSEPLFQWYTTTDLDFITELASSAIFWLKWAAQLSRIQRTLLAVRQ